MEPAFPLLPGPGRSAGGGLHGGGAGDRLSGPLSLEIFNDQFRSGSAVRTATDGLRSLILLEDQLEQKRERRRRYCCRRAKSRGVGFIEFALDETKAGELSTLFGQLGFRKTGSHRSKNVERWSQGKIELVINCEPDGFAHSHYIAHGPGVCAIAIDVDDAGKAMTRAEALKARTFFQPVGPGELEIPAIRGVGGSLLYFLEDPARTGTPISKRCAAIQRTTGSSRSITSRSRCPMMRCCRGCCSTREYLICDRLPQMEIADPVGLVQSQALINSDPGLRMILNGSSATRTLSARFISEFFGSGVQHIAFSCTDIFAAVADMRARGADFLKIPENYYDESKPNTISMRRRCRRFATTRFCTIAKARENSSRSIPTRSMSGFSSRSSQRR